MLQGVWNHARQGRANPFVPLATMAIGLAVIGTGYRFIGTGFMIGSALAYLNGALLSKRVELAADTGTVAAALMVMQVGFLIAMVFIGLATIVLVRISIEMAVASAAGFAVTQMAMLAVFYWYRARKDGHMEKA